MLAVLAELKGSPLYQFQSRQPLFLPVKFKLSGKNAILGSMKRYLSRLAECYLKDWDRKESIDKRLDFVNIHAEIPVP